MMPPINEHDEFLLSRLLDNDLPTAEADALRRRIELEPALREAYAALTGLDGLLKARQADQPLVDWGRFHAQVMRKVDADSRPVPQVIRLWRWVGIGAPLAAAAAIALVLTLRPFEQKPVPVGHPAPDSEVVVAKPSETDHGQLFVQVQRPAAVAPAPEGSIQVILDRSVQLTEATQRTDEAEAHMPTTLFAKHAPQNPGRSVVLDAFPL